MVVTVRDLKIGMHILYERPRFKNRMYILHGCSIFQHCKYEWAVFDYWNVCLTWLSEFKRSEFLHGFMRFEHQTTTVANCFTTYSGRTYWYGII